MKIKLLYLPKFEMEYNTGRPLDGTGWYKYNIPPLGIAVLTSFLKSHGIDAEQDDLLIKTCKSGIDISPFADKKNINKFVKTGSEETLEELGEKILSLTNVKGYDIIGLSLYESDNPTTGIIALVLAKILKEKYEPTIIIGGRIGDPLKEVLLKSGYIDYGICHRPFEGPAELNLLKFCEAWEKGNFEVKEIPGLEYIKNDRFVVNPTHYDKKEITFLPMPCFDGLPLKLYEYEVSEKIDGTEYKKKFFVLPYFFVKGCPNKCAFCTNSLSPFWVAKPPEKVKEELEFIKKKWKAKYFCFFNPEVNPNYKYAENLANVIKDLDIKWGDSATFANMDARLAKKLRDSGAVRLIFGIESCSGKILKYVGKNLNLSSVEKLLKVLSDIGIQTEVNLICGFPYENIHDINKTINFLKKNKKYIKVAYVNKFFLDGRMRVYPELYGIKIRREESFSRKVRKDVREDWRSGFDEINGLKWEKRRELTENFFNLLNKALAEMNISTASDLYLPFLRDYLSEVTRR